MNTQTEYLCKDCKYSKIPFMTKFGNILFFVKDEDFEYVCTRTNATPVVTHSPVVGTVVEKPNRNYERCYNERAERFIGEKDKCGPKGKYWTPKNKNDLFKYLKKI